MAEAEGEKARAAEEEFNGLDEEVEVSNRREVESQRHRRERYGEKQLQHLSVCAALLGILFWSRNGVLLHYNTNFRFS